MDSPNNAYPPFPEETLDLKRYFFLFLSKWYWIAICVFTGLFVAYLVNRYSEQVYSVKASLLVGNADGRKVGQGVQNLMREMNIMQDRKRIENEIGVLQSYTLTRTAIEELPDFDVTYVGVGRRGIAELKYYNRSPFVVNIDTTEINAIGYPVNINILSKNEYELDLDDGTPQKRIRFGEKYHDHRFAFTITLREPDSFELSRQSNKYYFIVNSSHSQAIAYMKKIAIELNDKQGSLLSLSTSGYVAQQEADFLNKLMEVYIRLDLQEKSLTAENTIDFVEGQLRGISDSLRKAELLLQNFRTGKGIIDLSTEGRTLLERLEALYAEKNALRLQLEYFEYLENYLKTKKDLKGLVAPATIGLDDASIAAIVSDLNQLTMERDGLLITLRPDNTRVLAIDQNINSLIELLFEKLEGMRKVNGIRIRELDRRVAEQEQQLRLLPVTERELVNMERMFNIHEKFYTYLMEKRIEAGIAKASSVSDNRIIDEARADMAIVTKPNRKMNYIMGFIIGLLIPVGLILLFDQLNNSIQDPATISKKTRTPMLGTIGHNPYESFLPVYDKPKSSFTESFRALRTNLDFMLCENKCKVILVSSTISGEGKSFVASNLAISMAMLGKKTLILGLDLRKPKVHSMFGVDNAKGMSTYLIGRDNLESVIVPTNIPNLSIIPSGPIPPNPAELSASDKLDKLVAELRDKYDMIVIDSPPVAVVTDAVLISRACDTTLFVVRHRYTSVNALDLVDDLTKNKTITNLAIVLNDFKKPKGYGYGYGYGYAYAYNYGYSYGQQYGQGYYTDDENGSKVTGFFKRFFG
ncbi:GumC family protein [Perlabentimonas gracilis]|uniref:GumC family protein n=1 Tax=Perlabentimonas gracilis TaxID=2715279 RepID=UPI00140C3EEB|nr:tyrosine-protein kinase family protein [Perlabentimonas gracilis]NHB70292.1 polysaccharide biosynthesis tyrosine autokinase [Perlabentimonas gracilis]